MSDHDLKHAVKDHKALRVWQATPVGNILNNGDDYDDNDDKNDGDVRLCKK